MKNISHEQMEEVLTEVLKRLAALETVEDARSYRESLFIPQFKSLCSRQGAEDVFNKSMVGPHNKPVVLPVLMEDEDGGGVFKAALNLETEQDKAERAFIKSKHLTIHQRVAAKRAKRMGKKGDPTDPQGINQPGGLF